MTLTQLGQPTPIPQSPEEAVLERAPNPTPTHDYLVRFTAPEFTSLCPMTAQPDFAHIVIDYVPDQWIVESKSLKLFLTSFRNHGAFHEACTMLIASRIVDLLAPRWLRIGAYWYPRGGIPIDVFWQTGTPPTGLWLPDQGVPTYRAAADQSARMTTRPNNLGLDVVRATAIIAVLFSHTADWFLGAGRSTDIHAAYIGAAGVEIFFSLSGFLIGGILLRALNRGLTLPALGQFWTRRWLRTLPAYWVLIGAMCWWFGVADWRSPIFLQNFVPMTQWAPLTLQTWSLVLEEWFYLFVPPLILLASLVLPKRWVVPSVCLALFAACTALRTQAWGPPRPGTMGRRLVGQSIPAARLRRLGRFCRLGAPAKPGLGLGPVHNRLCIIGRVRLPVRTELHPGTAAAIRLHPLGSRLAGPALLVDRACRHARYAGTRHLATNRARSGSLVRPHHRTA